MYRMVVQDKRTHPTREKVVARLGSYNPHTKEINIDAELAEKFLSNGAQPSDRAIGLLEKSGIKLPAWAKKSSPKNGQLRNPDKLRKNQPKEEEIPEEAVEAPEAATEEVTEAKEETVVQED